VPISQTANAAATAALKRLVDAPTTDFIYSSLSFFGKRNGGEIAGAWLVSALGELNIAATAVRQALFRMERAGSLTSRRVGRVKWYAPTTSTNTILAAGGQRVREQAERPWDGKWTAVVIPRGTDPRERQLLRDVLLVYGFGRARSGVYLHPRDHSGDVTRSVEALALRDEIVVYRAERVGGRSDEATVRELWDLQAIGRRYRTFVRRFASIADEDPAHWTTREAFGLRFAYMFDFFRISWDDPGLPSSFLPDDWAGFEARKIAQTLSGALRKGALEFADEIEATAASR
jgi:phenylacetic acid degradation operon negative regulatory protein